MFRGVNDAMVEARERLIEIHFPLQVHADDETASRLVAGDSRMMCALLYQAADDVAIHGVRSVTPIFKGADLKREAPTRRISHGWAGAALVWLAGLACGVVLASAVAMP